MNNLKGCFSSKSDDWETPQDLFNLLNEEFHFDLDACANSDNKKCPFYFSKVENGLDQSWAGHNVWVNPPYSQINLWVEKAYLETKNDNTVVVMLIPSRTDTLYFHNFIYHRSEIRFIKGRLHFNNSKMQHLFHLCL